MAIKIVVSNHVKFKVQGELTGSEGNKEKFDFTLTAKRLDQDGLNAAHASLAIDIAKAGNYEAVSAKVKELITDWGDVKDEKGEPITFTQDAFGQLLVAYPGMALHVWRTYQDEVGVRAKN